METVASFSAPISACEAHEEPVTSFNAVIIAEVTAGLECVQPYQGYEQPDEFVAEPLVITMTVPPGAVPGTKLLCSAPGGQKLRLTVPRGMPAGSVMTLAHDPVTKAWECVAVRCRRTKGRRR